MNKQRAIQMRIGLAGAILVVVTGGGGAFAQVTQDSTTWEGFYECDNTPVDANWVSLDGGGGNPIATVIPDPCDPGNNLLHFAPVEWYQGFGWSEDPGQWDPKTNGGMSIEWRINVTAGYQFAPLETSSPLAGRWMTTYVYPGFPDGKAELRDRDRAPRNVTLGFEDPNDPDNGGFHIFRLTCDDSTWTMYRFRNAEDPVYSGWITAPVIADEGPQSGYSFRFYNEIPDTVYYLDYIRWTNQGALLPRDPAFCGEPGTEYEQTDVNQDCYVNAEDLTRVTDEWLTCTHPADPTCDP